MADDPKNEDNQDRSGRAIVGSLRSSAPPDQSRSLLSAVKRGDHEAVAAALAKGADVNTQNYGSRATALHYAAAYCAHSCLRVLIRSGKCDYLIRDHKGLLPSEVAYEIADDPRAGGILAKLEARQAHKVGDASWQEQRAKSS